MSKELAANRVKPGSLAQSPWNHGINEQTFTDPSEQVELTEYRLNKQRKCCIGVRDLNLMQELCEYGDIKERRTQDYQFDKLKKKRTLPKP